MTMIVNVIKAQCHSIFGRPPRNTCLTSTAFVYGGLHWHIPLAADWMRPLGHLRTYWLQQVKENSQPTMYTSQSQQ